MEVDGNWINTAVYRNLSERFVITEKERKGAFTRQYFEVYEARLKGLRSRIIENADNIIGKGKYTLGVMSEVKQNCEVLLVGIIIKRIAQRPSILKNLLNEEKVSYDDYDENDENDEIKRYAGSSEDRLELESDKQIVRLEGNITMDDCATGCCIGVLGKLGKEGVFHVDKVIWPSQTSPKKVNSKPTIVAFISGLELTGNLEEDKGTISSFELMTSWLKGDVQSPEEDMNRIPRIDRLVIMGPSLDSKQNGCDVQSVVRTLTLSRQEKQLSTNALTMLDKLISSLTDKIQVDVCSAIGDPCSSMWPLPPIHRVCLPRTGLTEKKVNLVTNPYEFQVEDARFVISSGENVNNLLKTSAKWTGCDVLANMIKWQHIAPNCPDTLEGFPISDRDPLIMETTPHVMIAGNQGKAEIRKIEIEGSDEKCLTICIPKFSKSRLLCLLNLEDMSLSWRAFEHDF